MNEKSFRINVVDALRGFAILGILMVHCLEHFNVFVPLPKIDSTPLSFANAVFDAFIPFVFAGKAYAIFALLFGLSFFIQDDNQLKKGNDFRARFIWRLALLFVWGCINSIFYTGDVLVIFSFVGILLAITCRLSDKVVLGIAIFLFLQPEQWIRIAYSLIHPEYVPEPTDSINYWNLAHTTVLEGNFKDMIVGAWNSQMCSFSWWVEAGRIFQVGALFLFGMLIGRRKLFLDTEKNIRFWIKALIIGICSFLALTGLFAIIANFTENAIIKQQVDILRVCYTSFGFLSFLISLFVLAYYKSSLGKILSKLEPYGTMSLTMYISQSVLGGFVFYSWGLGLNTLPSTACIGIGILIFTVQYTFASWWLKSHRHGPLEYVWKKATWISFNKKGKESN